MKNIELQDIEEILSEANKNKIAYRRSSVPIILVKNRIAISTGIEVVFISEFIVAKIKGKINGFSGHLEITDTILKDIPVNLVHPLKILRDTRTSNKYLFVCDRPLHIVVVEAERGFLKKNEINTIYRTNTQELKRLERKFPVVYSDPAEPPILRISASRNGTAGGGLSSLRK